VPRNALVSIGDKEDESRFVQLVESIPDAKVVALRSSADFPNVIARANPDVVFLDIHLGELSIADVCRDLKRDRRLAGTQIVLVAREKTKAREIAKRVACDDLLELPITDDEAVRNWIAKQLFVRRRSDRKLTSIDALIHELTVHRVLGILSEDLFQLAASKDLPTARSDEMEKASLFYRWAHKKLAQEINEPEFAILLAMRCLQELASLVWVVATRALVLSGETSVRGLGSFDFDYIQRTIGFKADDELAQNSLPDIPNGLNSTQTEMLRMCQQQLLPLLIGTVDSQKNRNLSLEVSALGKALPLLISELEKSEGLISLMHDFGYPKGTLGSFALQAQIIAFASYFTIITAFTQNLHVSTEVRVPAIGVFRLQKQSVTFEAEREFVSLVEVNHVRAKGAANG
jgi:CheY-like chemotaxis protein